MDKPDPEVMETLEKALREEQAKAGDAKTKEEPKRSELEELKERHLRLAAELDNLRKRSAKDLKSAYDSGVESTLMPILKIFDVFELAIKASAKSDDIAAIRRGLDMVMTEFSKDIASFGVERIEDASGRDFDPTIHDAVMRSASDLFAEGKVIAQLNGGYRVSGRVIKAAQVIVSSGPETKSPGSN